MDSTANSAVATLAASEVASGSARLGNTAKSSSPLSQKKRAQRYSALGTARVWLYQTAQKIDGSANPGDLYRTHDCRYARRASQVEVHFTALHQSAHYGKVATCGSVWACPICCAKVQNRRRPELQKLISWSYDQGMSPSMVTLTFPHTKFDSLGDLISKQRLAFQRLRAGKVWQKFKEHFGFRGLVRSLELTHGKNGWHPHTHEIWLIRGLTSAERDDFKSRILARWIKACASVGLLDMADSQQLHAFHLHAVDVRFNVNDSDYLAKQDASRSWGVDKEMTQSATKVALQKGVHPHEFLVRQMPGDCDRYIEYVTGMKGARQLYWSPGLKGEAEIEEKTDEELSEEQLEAAEMLGLLTAEQWRVVRGNDARSELLDAAELLGWPGVELLLKALGADLPTLLGKPSVYV
jgi:hypothetical protein